MKDQQKYFEFLLKSSNPTLSEIHDITAYIVSINGFLVQKLFELQPPLREGQAYIETFVNKIIFTSRSILKLSDGDSFKIEGYNNLLEIIDTQSIFILTRSIIEGFLSLEYLYFNNLSESEQLFRFKLWKVSGVMARQQFASSTSDRFQEKLNNERKLIEEIKVEIKSSPYYSNLNKQNLWKLDNYGIPRLNSWGDLLSQSILRKDAFKKIYVLYTNYAHSEYLSIMQLKEGSLHKDNVQNSESLKTALNMICMVNATLTQCLLDHFPIVVKEYEELEESIKYPIDFWSKLATMS